MFNTEDPVNVVKRNAALEWMGPLHILHRDHRTPRQQSHDEQMADLRAIQALLVDVGDILNETL